MYPTKDGRRWSAWYNNHLGETSYIDTWTYPEDALIQRGIVDYSVTDPERDETYSEPDGPEDVNYGNFRAYTSFLTTHGFVSDQNRQPLTTPQHRWGPGHYFEIKVNFENMSMGGHRHSFWLMPADYDANGDVIGGNIAYDSNPSNGVEIDIYEYEAAPASTENTLYMKVLGNPISNGGTGNSNNTLDNADRPTGISYSGGGNSNSGGTGTEVTTTSSFPGGLLTDGWHKIGLYWSSSKLVWFLDGYPVVEDTTNVPTVPHYLLLTREINSGVFDQRQSSNVSYDPGIQGENAAIARNLAELGKKNQDGTEDFGLTGRDHVVVDYVKVWSFDDNGNGGNGITVPRNVAGTRYSNTAAEIAWDPPSNAGAGLDHYEVTRNGSLGYSGNGESWWMTDLSPSQEYTFEVSAVDVNSQSSPVACIELGPHSGGNVQAVPCGGSGGGGGNSPPTIPGNFTGAVYSSSALELFWNHSTDSDGSVIEYLVMNETTSTEVKRDYVQSAYITGLQGATSYDFSIVAIDDQGASSQVATVQLTTN
ncbi:fibronectin type III domain-containing protein [Granulosicoccus sp. 3-233]|uniref:fibronectin type III domain-containing protein n=1 Tax=Granulosicoccus sp. 3-233 TaxID=3417969 RepID=UPI003D354DCB